MERIDQRAGVTSRTRKGPTTREQDSGSRLTRLFCMQEKAPEVFDVFRDNAAGLAGGIEEQVLVGQRAELGVFGDRDDVVAAVL
jgi:hypothetical protein